LRDSVRTLLAYAPGIILVVAGVALYSFTAVNPASCTAGLDPNACYAQVISAENLGFGVILAGVVYLGGVFMAIGLSGSSFRPRLYDRWTGIPWGGRPKLVSEPVKRPNPGQK
jgi:hypothetical protein